jgi:hypothetical protein
MASVAHRTRREADRAAGRSQPPPPPVSAPHSMCALRPYLRQVFVEKQPRLTPLHGSPLSCSCALFTAAAKHVPCAAPYVVPLLCSLHRQADVELIASSTSCAPLPRAKARPQIAGRQESKPLMSSASSVAGVFPVADPLR